MIFFFDAQGDLIKSVPTNVYQGSNKASRIWFLMPTGLRNIVNVAFTLPNGRYAPQRLMTDATEGTGILDGDNKYVDETGQPISAWYYDLKSDITSFAGITTAQFFVTAPLTENDNEPEIIATQSVPITVLPGTPSVNEPITETEYEQIMAYLATFKSIIEVANGKLNIENGFGEFSLQQKVSEEGDENHAYGMRNLIAGGHKNKTYQRNSVVIGGGSQAGLTEEEFNAKYPSGFDENNRPYSTSYGWCFAIGQDNKTLGKNAYVMGYHNKANDLHDYIYGWYNTLHGSDQFTIGEFNNSNGYRNYSIGYNNLVGEFNKSGTDNNGFAIYTPSKAIDQAFVLGAENKVNSRLTNVIGCGNKSATGHNNIIGTSNEILYGERVSLLGYGLKYSSLDGCVILGTYNDKEYSLSPALIIGAGTSDSDRRNVFEVEKDGRAKVFGAPVDENDVVRKKELDENAVLYRHNITLRFTLGVDEVMGENYASIYLTHFNHKSTAMTINEIKSEILNGVVACSGKYLKWSNPYVDACIASIQLQPLGGDNYYDIYVPNAEAFANEYYMTYLQGIPTIVDNITEVY